MVASAPKEVSTDRSRTRRVLTCDEEETYMRRIFALVIAVGLMTALLALPGTAIARAEFSEYTGTETKTALATTFENVRGTNVIHMDFYSEWNDVTEDPRATGLTKVSGHLAFTDIATGTGIMHGTSVTEVDNTSGTGTWVGHWQGKLVGNVGSFKAVAYGTGDFAGLKMMATFTGLTPAVVHIEGRILDPHGN
jgi:hypothetical protein